MRRLAVAALVLLVAACGSDGGDGGDGHGAHGDGEVAEGARTIVVRGRSFAFDPARIVVSAGEDVAVELTAVDAEHDFVVDELDAHVDAAEGETATGGFSADEAGTYTYYCSVPGHREAGMEGELVVE